MALLHALEPIRRSNIMRHDEEIRMLGGILLECVERAPFGASAAGGRRRRRGRTGRAEEVRVAYGVVQAGQVARAVDEDGEEEGPAVLAPLLLAVRLLLPLPLLGRVRVVPALPEAHGSGFVVVGVGRQFGRDARDARRDVKLVFLFEFGKHGGRANRHKDPQHPFPVQVPYGC
jgi:hypothetical protein